MRRPECPVGIRYLALCLAAALCLPPDAALGQATLERLPYRNHPVGYFGPSDNAVSRLIQQVERGELTLEQDADRGSLPALLQALRISEASQMLVFAKNAVNARLISPRNPRALYFNDEISVGWTPGAAAIELSVIDPRKGPIFYSLRFPDKGPPLLRRDDQCLTCHVSQHTLQVPGFILRSFLTDAEGKPLQGYSGIDHTTPYPKRWGGWYVTGDAHGLEHLGNLATTEDLERYADSRKRVAVIELAGSEVTKHHLRHTSDVLPLLVHDHQMRFYTLLTRLRYEAEFDRPLATLESFVRCLLMMDEPSLPAPVQGNLEYRTWFEQPPAADGDRSLRELDLKTRLLRRRCSWLIGSPAFRELPESVVDALSDRLRRILDGGPPPLGYEMLSRTERDELRGILLQKLASLRKSAD